MNKGERGVKVHKTTLIRDKESVESGEHLLRLQNVSKSFGSIQALTNLNLELTKGECLVILGPAGAGKTTTLKVIAGLEKANSGKILFNDRIVNNLEPQARNIGMVFETYALYPHISVYRNLASSLEVLKLDPAEIREKVEKIARMLGIFPFLDRKPGFLSGGQRQRVALGRALAKPADLYLLDEPIAHLDAKLRFQMIGEFKHLQESLKISIVYVTHDWREAMSLGNHIIVLREGVVEQYGTPSEVFRNPDNTFVATMIGDPPMNLVPGIVESGPDLARFKGSGLEFPLKGRVSPGSAYLGIRPSRIKLGTPADHNARVEVYSSGKHGMNTVVSFKLGDGVYKTELKESLRFEIGEQIPIRIDPQRACLFDENHRLIHVLED